MRYLKLVLLFLILNLPFYLHAQKSLVVKRQKKPMIMAKFSPTGNYFAGVGSDKTIKIWSVLDGSLVKSFFDNQDGEISIDFSPDGEHFVTGGWDGDVKIWNFASGKVEQRLKGHTKSLRTAIYHPNGKLIASAGWDNDIIIWYAPTGLLYKKLIGHDQCVRSLAFSPNGRYLASGGYDLTLRIWDLLTGKQIHEIKAHKMPVESVDFSPDGKYVVTGSTDNTIKVWNAETGILSKSLKGHNSSVYWVSYSPDGKFLASAGNDNRVIIWNMETKAEEMIIADHSLSVKSVHFNPNAKSIVTASFDKSVMVFDVSKLNAKIGNFPQVVLPQEKGEGKELIAFQDFKEVVYERDYNLKAIIMEEGFDKYRLFVNGAEHTEYDGNNKFTIKPEKYTGEKTELYYKIYLHEGINEIQLSMEKDGGKFFHFSKAIKVNYTDLDQQMKKTRLFAYVVNPPQYLDKRLNKDYIQAQTEALLNTYSLQKGMLYNEIIVSNLNTSETTSKSAIEAEMANVNKQMTENDEIVLLLSGQIVKSEDYFLLPSDFEGKDFSNAVNIKTLVKYFMTKSNQITMLMDISNKHNNKDLAETDPLDIEEYFKRLFDESGNDFAFIIYNGKEKGEFYNIVNKVIKDKNDSDFNGSLDFKELIAALNENILFEYKQLKPLFLFEQKN
ncbi:MAG: WD40 repeat domain-containing protein [Bacteroidales bacterium]|nr:WD40 repeat domain-containing protein [Bacteroidales bacterium]